MNKLALCITTAILAATACTEPPGDDGGGTTDTLGDRADGGADETAADEATVEDAAADDAEVVDATETCSAGCVADGWRSTCTRPAASSDGPAWCGDASCDPTTVRFDGLGDGWTTTATTWWTRPAPARAPA